MSEIFQKLLTTFQVALFFAMLAFITNMILTVQAWIEQGTPIKVKPMVSNIVPVTLNRGKMKIQYFFFFSLRTSLDFLKRISRKIHTKDSLSVFLYF